MKKRLYTLFMMAVLFMTTVIPVNAASKVTIKLNKSSTTINMAASKTLKLKATVTGSAKTVKWKSSNKKVATVNASGKVTAKKAGKATITACIGKNKATCKVTVKKGLTTGKTGTYIADFGSTLNKIFVKQINKGKIKFQMYFVGRYGYGESNVITVVGNGKKVTFSFKDNSTGAKGTGTLVFEGDSIILTAKKKSGESQLYTDEITLDWVSNEIE